MPRLLGLRADLKWLAQLAMTPLSSIDIKSHVLPTIEDFGPQGSQDSPDYLILQW